MTAHKPKPVVNTDLVRLPTAEDVKAAREVAGLTQKQAGDIFGYQLRSWQKKEEAGSSYRQLSLGEWHFLLLLADGHPQFSLKKKEK